MDSWPAQWGRANGVAVSHWSHSGDSGPSFTDADGQKWKLYGDRMAPLDVCFYSLHNNDMNEAVTPTLAEMQARVRTILPLVRKYISPNVVATTITPRDAVTGAAETLRRQFNAWLKTSGLFRDVFDVSAAISNDDETIRPEFNADGIHMNTAGYAAMAAAINRPVVKDPTVVTSPNGTRYRLAVDNTGAVSAVTA